MEKDWRYWAEAEDAMDRAREQRHFGVPTGEQRLCKRCGKAVLRHRDRIDGANNFEEQDDIWCSPCQRTIIQNTSVGCDE